MDVLVCVKRVPAVGARLMLTEDQRAVDTRNLGFSVSPHEECAVEEAVRLVEQHGGRSTVLSLGPAAAGEQLREALAVGIDHAILLEISGEDWDPMATADAITAAIRAQPNAFDVLLFGNEAADSGDYQVGIRVAHALDLPCVVGIKSLDVTGNEAVARRETKRGWETYRVPLPAAFTVREGINLPRYPSLPGKLRAKKKPIEQHEPVGQPGKMELVRLITPKEQDSQVEILGHGAGAAPKIVSLLAELGMV